MTELLEEQEIELEARERRLREANRLRGNFLINVSRELRTPLTLISGYVTLLQSTIPQLDLEETPLSLVEMVEGMAQGTKRMNDVVRELMRVSRIVTGDVSLALGPTRVHTLVSATLSELSDKERALVEQGPLEELPIVQVDGNQVRLAIRNILSHLINILPEGGQIILKGQRQQDIVILSLEASGVEMDPAEQEMLFDRLYPIDQSGKEDSQDMERKSLGFGLAVASGIIQAHNGRLWIESSGSGEKSQSTFYLLLPVSS
jgi:signal transduction histidine kinase